MNKDGNDNYSNDRLLGRLGPFFDPLWNAVAAKPKLFIAAVIAISMIFAWLTSGLKIDPSLESMSVENSPEKLSYRKFLDTYGSDEFLIIAAKVKQGDLFTTKNLATIKALSDEMTKIPRVQEVISLSTTDVVRPVSGGIDIEPLYDEPPTDAAELEKLKHEATTHPLLAQSIVSVDGKTCVWYLYPDLRKGDTTQVRIDIYEGAAAAAEKHLVGFEYHMEGIPTVKRYMVVYIERAITIFGLGSMLLLGIVLYITFRAIRGVVLPGLVVGLALTWTLGTMAATGGVMDSICVLLFALISVVGVGDTVHIMVHYLEEYFRHNDKRKALILTMRRMFTPCLLTSVTTTIGFLSLLTIRIPPIQRFGLYAGVGVTSAFVISIILAPAILMLLPPPTARHRKNYDQGYIYRGLVWLGGFNKRRPALIVSIAILIVVFSIAGIQRIRVETKVSEFFHKWSPLVVGYKFLEQNVTPPVPIEIVLEGSPGVFKKPETWAWMEALQEDLTNIPLIERADSYSQVLRELNWALNGGDIEGAKRELPKTSQAIAQFSMLFQDGSPETFERFMGNNFDKAHITLRLYDSSSKEQQVVIDRIKALLNKHAPNDVHWELAGATIIFVSAVGELTKGQIRSLILALAVITLMITLIFRSLRIGALSMIPNVLPILTMLGIMGWLDFPLDTNTVMIGPITLGIAVDDTIHYITRFKREQKHGVSPAKAMEGTLLSTGRALVSTSMILALGFSVTILSSFRPQSILGGLGGLTIMMALVADLIVLPVVMLWLYKKKKVGD